MELPWQVKYLVILFFVVTNLKVFSLTLKPIFRDILLVNFQKSPCYIIKETLISFDIRLILK